jgi:hypothetical protein
MPDVTRSHRTRCLLIISHLLNDVTLARFRQCQAELGDVLDVILVLSEPLEQAVEQHGLRDVVCLHGAELFRPEYGRKTATGRIKPGHADLIPLAFWRRHPGYDYYWVAEFDVYAPLGLRQLATLDAGSEADLLGTFLRRQSKQGWWEHWATLERGPTRGGAEAQADGTACFLPLSRYSARLLDTLDWSYRHGWMGHHEATIATIAASNQMLLEDLDAVARRSLGQPVYDYESFNHERCRDAQPHFFCHPIKNASQIATLHSLLFGDAGPPRAEGAADRNSGGNRQDA